MKKLATILVIMMSVTSCSQMTTNADERSALEATANSLGDIYVTCVVNYSLDNSSTNAIDVASVVTLAGRACETDLAQFKNAQEDYLSTQVMMTDKPLQASVDALNERATAEVGEALLSSAKTQPAAALTAVAVAAAPPATGDPEGWSSEQQAYLNCMDKQAHKYAALDESAPVIADVAQDRCKSYMTGPGVAALEQEGRATAMGIVLDAKLERTDRTVSE